MQIFTPADARSAAEKRVSKEEARAHTIIEVTKELLDTKTQAEQDFERTLKRQQKTNEQEYEASLRRKLELNKEVEALEERKRQALSPLIEREKTVELAEESIRHRQADLDMQEEDLEEKTRLLMEKLDDVSSRELQVADREAYVQRLQQGVEIQRDQTAQDARNLAIQLSEFQKQVEDKEVAFAFRQSELDAQENLYKEKDGLLLKREEEVKEEWIRIRDQRIQLDKAFTELRKNTHGSGLSR